jgi:hypothetical protein
MMYLKLLEKQEKPNPKAVDRKKERSGQKWTKWRLKGQFKNQWDKKVCSLKRIKFDKNLAKLIKKKEEENPNL